MKISIKLSLLHILICLSSLNGYAQTGKIRTGDKIPQLSITSETYGNVSTEDTKGKVVLISLFATWCPPCQKELADIENILYPKYKNNNDFMLLVVGREHTDEELKRYNSKKNFTFPLYPDPERKVFSLFADQNIPRAYLFGKDGKLVYTSSGYSTEDFSKLMDRIEIEINK